MTYMSPRRGARICTTSCRYSHAPTSTRSTPLHGCGRVHDPVAEHVLERREVFITANGLGDLEDQRLGGHQYSTHR
jgi:hypothetical protein